MRLYLILFTLSLFTQVCFASVTVTVNGSNHTIPQTNEKGWGTNVTAWIQAISNFTLQPNGGTFTLTADTDFGASFGLKSAYFKSRTSNISTVGALRLANSDSVGFRNNANSANLLLSVDSSDRLLFNSVILSSPTSGSFQDSTFEIYDNGDATKKISFQASGITTATTRTITVPDANVDLGGLTNSNIASGAAIVDTKLATISTASKVSNSATTATNANTASAIVARDGSGNFIATTITAALTGNASTATALASDPSDCSPDTYANVIAASGNLSCVTVTNAGLAGSIAASKLVGSDIATVGTVTSGTWSAGTIALNKGGTGQTTKAAAFDALQPMSASGDVIYGGVSGTGTRLAKGSDTQVLTLASGLPTWATPATALTQQEVYVSLGNGYGSTNTKIRRYSTTNLNVGTSITYADSAGNGGSFTINDTGIYAISGHDFVASGNCSSGISVNTTGPTTNIYSLSFANGFRTGPFASNASMQSTSWVGWLTATDVVRAHGDGACDSTDVRSNFHIVRLR